MSYNENMYQYQRNYGNAIWTNHALERLSQRRLPQEMALQAFQNPDHSQVGKQKGTIEYQKSFGKTKVTIIAKQNEYKQWIVLSCWIDPSLPGSIDAKKRANYRAYKKASFWGKFFIIFKKQLGF